MPLDFSFLTNTDASFLVKVIQALGLSGLLFVVWYLQRKSEDRRLTMIMKAEEKKWTQKFQEEREYRQQKFDEEHEHRDQQFKIFLNLMENVQTHTAMLNTIVNLLNNHPRMFDDLAERIGLTSDGINIIHRRIDTFLLESAKGHASPLSSRPNPPHPPKDPA